MRQLSLFEGSLAVSSGSIFSGFDKEHVPFRVAEVLIEERLLNELSEFEPQKVNIDVIRDINYKWKYSSAFQKSIRRGSVDDAVRYALAYHSVDPVGFWPRLVHIAYEDVGVGDVWVVAMTLAAARSSAWRKKAGGDELIIHLIVKQLSDATKSRTVYDYLNHIENCLISSKERNDMWFYTSQEPSDIALSKEYELDVRTSAAWILSGGDKLINNHLPFHRADRVTFKKTIDQLSIPWIIKYITLRGIIACRYAMNICYPFVWEMLELSQHRKVIETKLPERYYIGGIPEEAWDKHTREGKTAYQHFHRTCEPVRSFLASRGIVENDGIIATIGISIFIMESAILKKRINFDGAEQIYMMSVEDDYRKNGLTLDEGMHLSKLILENSDILRRSRQYVVE